MLAPEPELRRYAAAQPARGRGRAAQGPAVAARGAAAARADRAVQIRRRARRHADHRISDPRRRLFARPTSAPSTRSWGSRRCCSAALAGGLLLVRMSLYPRAARCSACCRRSPTCRSRCSPGPARAIRCWCSRSASRISPAAWARRRSSPLPWRCATTAFRATQYALLSALASLGRILFGPVTGGLVEAMGWAEFLRAHLRRRAARAVAGVAHARADRRGGAARPATASRYDSREY